MSKAKKMIRSTLLLILFGTIFPGVRNLGAQNSQTYYSNYPPQLIAPYPGSTLDNGCTQGGEGGPRPDGAMELGFCAIEATEAGREMFDGLSHIYQAHYEGITRLPEGAEVLARSEAFPVQAYRLGSAIGLQCHPDAKAADIADWFGDNDSQSARPGIQPLSEQLAMAQRHEAAIQSWTERFIDGWIGAA